MFAIHHSRTNFFHPRTSRTKQSKSSIADLKVARIRAGFSSLRDTHLLEKKQPPIRIIKALYHNEIVAIREAGRKGGSRSVVNQLRDLDGKIKNSEQRIEFEECLLNNFSPDKVTSFDTQWWHQTVAWICKKISEDFKSSNTKEKEDSLLANLISKATLSLRDQDNKDQLSDTRKLQNLEHFQDILNYLESADLSSAYITWIKAMVEDQGLYAMLNRAFPSDKQMMRVLVNEYPFIGEARRATLILDIKDHTILCTDNNKILSRTGVPHPGTGYSEISYFEENETERKRINEAQWNREMVADAFGISGRTYLVNTDKKKYWTVFLGTCDYSREWFYLMGKKLSQFKKFYPDLLSENQLNLLQQLCDVGTHASYFSYSCYAKVVFSLRRSVARPGRPSYYSPGRSEAEAWGSS